MKKKTPKEATALFERIIKASVAGNPKPKLKKEKEKPPPSPVSTWRKMPNKKRGGKLGEDLGIAS